MKEFFDDYVQTVFGENNQAEFKFRQFERNYQRFFPQRPDAPLLDVGIGRGEMLSSMKAWGYTDYRGIDISPSTVAFCASLGLPCERVEDTAAWLREHRGSFALITLLDVLEHVPKGETVAFLAALRGALAPGGTLIVQVPNMQAPDSQLHRYNDFTHEAGFTENSLRQVLLTAGFGAVSFQGFEDSVARTLREKVRLLLRPLYWRLVRLTRKLNGNLSPAILHPVFYAVAASGDAATAEEP
ncbi:MAG: class I SAM-dependent methyltransferase [Desulfuromonadales bacterium]|nr:MAG: class I SAM-dependent methyltransferase [Desulfuromonadales bacterium]